jgi:hypothetical protein
MRKVFSVALMAAMVCLVGMTKDASATITVTLEWGACSACTGLGTDTLLVAPGGGQTLRLDIFMSHDVAAGFESHSFSLNFDTALDNELNLGPMTTIEWGGSDVDPGPNTSSYSALSTGVSTLDSTGANAGRANSFESAGITGVLPASGVAYSVGTNTATAPARYRVGQAFFTVTASAASDGADIFSGAFNLPGIIDTFVDGNGTLISNATVIYGNATVNIPEPGTVSLLGLGILGLVLAGRRVRRS